MTDVSSTTRVVADRRARRVDDRPPRKGWTLILASIGVFMTSLDTLVVATALPVLRLDLDASLADLEWTVNAYNLAFACLLLTGAALGDRFGRRRMFNVGVFIFTVASVAAAVSPSVGALIAARALQGAGAAIVLPLTLTLISEAFPADQRGLAIGLSEGAFAGLAVAAGPVIGGAVVEGLDWRWIFWINVPIGLLLIPLSARFLSESFGPRPQLDAIGNGLVAAGLFGLTWGLVRANTVGWGTAEVLLTLAGGAALVGAFVAWERRAQHPMIPLALFRSRGFSTANAVTFFQYAAVIGSLFLIAQFLQTSLGYSPLQAGIRTLPWTGTLMLAAPIAGGLADRLGNRPFMVLGLALQATGLVWIAAIAAPDLNYAWFALALVVNGLGASMVFPAVLNTAVGSVPPQEIGVASGTNGAFREVGGVFGVAILAVVFAQFGALASAQAFADGFGPAMWVGAALPALGIVAALLSPKRQPADTDTKADMVTAAEPLGRCGGRRLDEATA
jgi:EmrB/QacA subfamily drug resistance transporter